MKPVLDARGIQLILVGMDTFALEDFLTVTGYNGKFCVDEPEAIFKALDLKRINLFNAIPMLISASSREEVRKVKDAHVGGNLRGDGYQLGGVLIVKKGGKLVAFRRQESPAEIPMHPSEVLKIIDEHRLTASSSPAKEDGPYREQRVSPDFIRQQ